MAWTTPPTLTDGQVLTGAHTQIWRDDLNATAPALATTAGRWFIATGTNAIAERAISSNAVITSESTATTSFIDLTTPGPAVTATTGTNALVIITSEMANNTINGFALASYAVSSATTIAATVGRAIWVRAGVANQGIRASVMHMETGLTAGSNIFTMKYEASNTGTAEFQERRIVVMAL